MTSEEKREYNQRYYAKKKKRRALAGATAPKNVIERKVYVKVHLPESLVGRLNRVVLEGLAKGTYPWKNMTEAIRDLLIEGFKAWKGDELFDELIPQLEYMQVQWQMKSARMDAQGALSAAREEISHLMSIGAKGAAVNHYHYTLETAHAMPPTQWRDWMIAELKAAFPKFATEKLTPVNLSAAATYAMEHPAPIPGMKRKTKGPRQ